MLVILVRTDDAADMASAVRLQPGAARPEPTRLEKDLGPGVEKEPLILGRLPILPDRVGHIRADVLLLLAAQDVDDLPVRPDRLLRRRLRAGIGDSQAYSAPRHPIRAAAFSRAPSRVRKRYISSDRAASGHVKT